MVNGYWFPSLAAAAEAPAGKGFDFAEAAAAAAAEAARAKEERRQLKVRFCGFVCLLEWRVRAGCCAPGGGPGSSGVCMYAHILCVQTYSVVWLRLVCGIQPWLIAL